MNISKVIKVSALIFFTLLIQHNAFGQSSRTFLNTSTGTSGSNTPDTTGNLGGSISMTSGYYQWTVPATGNYSIEAWGAQGGKGNGTQYPGGKGAKMKGDFLLTQGDVLNIVIGQMGSNGNSSEPGGGGGGTFVYKGAIGGSGLHIAAGGGGGGGEEESQGGHYGTTALTGYHANGPTNVNYAAAGFGSPNGTYTGSAAGWKSDGSTSFTGRGIRWIGGYSRSTVGDGGFGGGAAGVYSNGGGSGGGYSGGPTTSYDSRASYWGGGGGGSYNAGSNQSNQSNYNSSHGKVIITQLCTPANLSIIEPSKTVTYGDAGFSLNHTTSSSGLISYSSENTDIATIDSSGNVIIIGAGTVNLIVDQVASGDSCADTATMVLTVAEKPITVNGITANDKEYDSTTSVVLNSDNLSNNGGIIDGDDVTSSFTGVFSDEHAGTGITVNLTGSSSGADVDNYSITYQASTTASITKKVLTIDGITASDKAYDETTTATINDSGITYTGLVSGDDVTASFTGVFSDANTAVGKTVSLTASLSGSDVENYEITTQASTTASITASGSSGSGVSYTFTNAGASGYQGPTQNQVNTAYSGTSLDGSVTVNSSYQGVQQWVVPSAGNYQIEVYGAQGGEAFNSDYHFYGGDGAKMVGSFTLQANEQLNIVIGQQGGSSSIFRSGGGGGSFVWKETNTELIIAAGGGGGGGASFTSGNCNADANVTTSGNDGNGVLRDFYGGAGGTNGSGGQAGRGGNDLGVAAGGAGWLENGVGDYPGKSKLYFTGGNGILYGGFGGGGGVNNSGAAGGGGYSGGGGSGWEVNTPVNANSCGGGAGSFNSGLNQLNVAGFNSGHGYVKITQLCDPSSLTVSATKSVYANDDNFTLEYTSDSDGTVSYSSTDSNVATIDSVTGEVTIIGSGTVTLTVNQAAYNYYCASSATMLLTVTKPLITITPSSTQSKTYGALDPTIEYTVSPTSIAGISDVKASLTGVLTRTSGEDVGTYSITVGTLTSTDFVFSLNPVDFTINKLPVTVTPTATQSKTYGEADLTLTYDTSPTLNSTLTNTTGTVTFTGALSRDAGTNVGSYSITIGTLTNTNYDVTFTETDYTINRRPITISAEAKTKVYGATDPSLTYTITAGSIVS